MSPSSSRSVFISHFHPHMVYSTVFEPLLPYQQQPRRLPPLPLLFNFKNIFKLHILQCLFYDIKYIYNLIIWSFYIVQVSGIKYIHMLYNPLFCLFQNIFIHGKLCVYWSLHIPLTFSTGIPSVILNCLQIYQFLIFHISGDV